MARSSYVYIVTKNQSIVVAGFTVKHECISWLKRIDSLHAFFVQRVADGGHGDPSDVQTAIEFVAFAK